MLHEARYQRRGARHLFAGLSIADGQIYGTCRQRKCLQPNHFVTTTALETALTDYIAYYNQTAKPINWTYTPEKLEQKLGKHL